MDENITQELLELEGAALINMGHFDSEPSEFYVLTTDEKIVEGKEYYQQLTEYILSTDTEVDEDKNYYVKNNDEYIEVENPSGNPRENEYYELSLTYTIIENPNPQDNPSQENWYIKIYNFDLGTTKNYGIGINSSDDFLALPARAISLFQTEIKPEQSIRVAYDFQGILGTLPEFREDKVSDVYSQYMVNTQGLFTDNIYIGDKNNYIAFYSDEQENKHLKIVASDIIREVQYYENYIECIGEDFNENITYYIYDNNTSTYIEVQNPQPEDIDTYYRLAKVINTTTWDDYIENQKLKYIWENLTNDYPPGLYMASGGLTGGNNFKKDDSNTYGFNSFIDSSSLNLRYNAIDLLSLQSIDSNETLNDDTGLTIYLPQYSNNEIIGNNKRIQISAGNGIQFFIQEVDPISHQQTDKVVAQYNQDFVIIGQTQPDKETVDNELIDIHKNYTVIDSKGLHIKNTYYNDLTRDIALFSGDAIKFDGGTEFYLGGENEDVYIKFIKSYNRPLTPQDLVNDLVIKAKSFILGNNNINIETWMGETTNGITRESIERGNAINGVNSKIEEINEQLNGKIYLDTDTPQLIVGYQSNPDIKTVLTTNSLIHTKNEQEVWSIKSEEARFSQTTSNKIKIQANIADTTEENYFLWEKRQNGHLSLKLRIS